MTFPNSCHFHLEKCVKFYADSLSSPDFIMTALLSSAWCLPFCLSFPSFLCLSFHPLNLNSHLIYWDETRGLFFTCVVNRVTSLRTILEVNVNHWRWGTKTQKAGPWQRDSSMLKKNWWCLWSPRGLLAFPLSLPSGILCLKAWKLIFTVIFLFISRVSFREISHKVCLTTLIFEIQQEIYCNTILKLKQEEVERRRSTLHLHCFVFPFLTSLTGYHHQMFLSFSSSLEAKGLKYFCQILAK